MNTTKNQNEEVINNANLDLNRKHEKTKIVKARPCDSCGNTIGVRYKMCPYAQDVYNEIVFSPPAFIFKICSSQYFTGYRTG